MRTRFAIFCVTYVVLAELGQSSHGFEPAPWTSYTQDTACGTYRFVMIGPHGPKDDPIRARYPASGLYRIGAPPVPLWTVAWYAYKGRVEPLSDGVHLVVQPGASWDGIQPGVSFFANGQLLRAYKDRELVDNHWLLETGGHGGDGPRRLQLKLGNVDEVTLTYHLAPGDGTQYTFDITTGRIVSEVRPVRRTKAVASLLLLALNLAVALWIVLRPLRAKPPLPPAEQTP